MSSLIAQSSPHIPKIENLKLMEQKRHKEAINFAKLHGLDTVGVRYINENGSLEYVTPMNADAAAYVNTDQLHIGGGAGLMLEGENMTIGLWDLEVPHPNHFAFQNADTSRVVIQNPLAIYSDHPTHVAGTLIADASGSPQITGMAPLGTIHAYDSEYELSELWSIDSLLVTVQAFGNLDGYKEDGTYSGQKKWVFGSFFDFMDYDEDSDFGRYSISAYEYDLLLYNKPHMLTCIPAGNEGIDNPEVGDYIDLGFGIIFLFDPATHILGDGQVNGGFDNINSNATGKNILTVGAMDPEDLDLITNFSSRGPVDDGRIKPEIVAPGANLWSAEPINNIALQSGTSSATAVVAGSSLLLQEHYQNLSPMQDFMTSSMLKSLLIHTAVDIHALGPDYTTGFGRLDTKAAADLISAHFSTGTSQMIQDTFVSGSKTYGLISTCAEFPNATLAYIDKPSEALTGLDNPTPALQIDLDMALGSSGGVQELPFKLDKDNPTSLATTGDNDVDNIEKIISSQIENLNILSIINETHPDSSQIYSLVLSNIQNVCQVVSDQNENTIINEIADYCNSIGITTRATVNAEATFISKDKVTFLPGFNMGSGVKLKASILLPCE